MTPVDWITLAIAVLGAVLGVVNTIRSFWIDQPRLKVSGYVCKHGDNYLRLRVKLVNTGRVAVTVEKVFLTRKCADKPKRWQLWEERRSNGKLPAFLEPGKSGVAVIAIDAVKRPLVDKCTTVVAQTAQGRYIKGACTGLSELAAQTQASSHLPGRKP